MQYDQSEQYEQTDVKYEQYDQSDVKYLTVVFEITDSESFREESDKLLDRMMFDSTSKLENPVVAAAWEHSIEHCEKLEQQLIDSEL